MTSSDSLLERIIKRVNASGERFDITLTVGGTVVTGQITPRSVWLNSAINVLLDAGSDHDGEFATEGGELDNEEYVHLTEARAVFGMDVPVPVGAGYLRIPTDRVDSWSLGRVDISPAG